MDIGFVTAIDKVSGKLFDIIIDLILQKFFCFI
jgi:hypothetical protein